ncbi:MAG: 4-hydroxythreonine-4-phosphate dehydrogenase PdxA [Gemmataceae bacterium]|nr:4-hydroxythreonine-4-phosphate dehydrogenase PdxA [Gemmataceae bacterium]MCI0740435.1 4-hydroxythreonine-4-phosphate dehydrogenase PdxA [Gemmataceae bacterium]
MTASLKNSPRLLITLGDVAGIGPEIVVKAWPHLVQFSRPAVVGDPNWLRWAARLVQSPVAVVEASSPLDITSETGRITCVRGSEQDLREVAPGQLSAAAGKAAYDFLCTAIASVRHGEADAIVTLPLHKEGLRAAGLPYPGHTEILAEKAGVREYGMMLYARWGGPLTPNPFHPKGEGRDGGLGVVHVTLHMSLHDVFQHITTSAVLEKIRLLDAVLRRLSEHAPRLAVAALNPHASDGGLFGDEERLVIGPAVQQAQQEGVSVIGPLPSDTLFVRAARGEFDGIVAMYHDQGHIPMKLLSGLTAVNITLGLPIVRTSVAHGTAYDIAGKGIADHRPLVEAARVAAQLVRTKCN